MTQAVGALLLLLGALMYHIASSDLPHHSIADIYKDILNIVSGGK
jgi:hypothetical protein